MTLKINDFYDLGKYRLFRNDAKDSKYKYVYVIMVNEAEKRYKFGTLQFGLYGMDKRRNMFPNGCLKIWFIVENRQLYTPDFLDRLIDVINTFSYTISPTLTFVWTLRLMLDELSNAICETKTPLLLSMAKFVVTEKKGFLD